MAQQSLIVLAHCDDQAARIFVDRWAAHGARLITPEDLSMVGWCFSPGLVSDTRIISDNVMLETQAVGGVLVRLSSVIERDLLHIVEEDRVYVAAEMTAFLRAWLATLPCPVLNRPSTLLLNGPYWRPERWAYTAVQLGIPIVPVDRIVRLEQIAGPASSPTEAGVSVSIIGTAAISSVDHHLVEYARELAEAAAVDMLTVGFDSSHRDARFTSANLWVDITNDDVAAALLGYFGISKPHRR